jgi:diadenosine tetraphosphatase ApaH/serine/threonine PP2A family protein phosphatase
MDGLDTVQSYSADACETLRTAMSAGRSRLYSETVALPYQVFFETMPAEHVDFFDDLPISHRTPECVCAHGGIDPTVGTLEDQPRRALIWGASGFPREYRGDELVVYGHWNNAVLDASGWPSPLVVGNTIGLDTIAYGVLSAILLPERRVFQSAFYESAVRDD